MDPLPDLPHSENEFMECLLVKGGGKTRGAKKRIVLRTSSICTIHFNFTARTGSAALRMILGETCCYDAAKFSKRNSEIA